MSELPVRRRSGPLGSVAVQREFVPQREAAPHLSELIAIIFRHGWLIAACTVSMVGLAAIYTMRSVPIYEAASLVRIEEKQANLPEFYRTLNTGTAVETEIEVLHSETLAQDATTQLGLQVRVSEPTGVSRADVFGDLSVASTASPQSYLLRREADGRFTLHALGERDSVLAHVALGEKVSVNGITFSLKQPARDLREVRFYVQSLEEAAGQILAGLSVTRANREANVLRVAYRDADRRLAAQIPNAIVAQFIARRKDAQKTEARSTVAFLRQQIDTLATQLKVSEDKLRTFRETERVVNPEVEANSQVTRLLSLQSERGTLEAERAALAKLLREVRASKGRSGEATPSPYRRLVAFPTLLHDQAASELLKSLATVEDQRTSLLSRRTPSDPDVKALDNRVEEIEQQIGSVAATYLEGLTNQVAGLDSTLRTFGRQLSEVPRRELEFNRLERQPKLLEQVYSLLQTRLKEAEIAQAVEDPSVQVVDPAGVPRTPVSPRRRVNLAAGLMVGLLLGVAGAFMREYMDRSVHTRADILLATGLPVIGLIPSIPRGRESIALISTKREGASSLSSRRRRSGAGSGQSAQRHFTFLPSAVHSTVGDGPASGAPAVPRRVQRMVITDVGTAIAEAYGSLLTNLMYAKAGDPVRTLVFTSAQPGEGKTTSAVNLALSLAHRGMRALLIDADLRRGTIHTVFGTARQPGLSDVVQAGCSLEHALRYVNVDDGETLHYLTSGTLPGNPAAMIESQALHDLLHQLAERYDTIIVDSPPATVITDAALLGSHVDGVVIVARAGVTHAAALGVVMEQLDRVRAQVLGVVLNDIDFKRDSAYDPSYQYHEYTSYFTPTGE